MSRSFKELDAIHSYYLGILINYIGRFMADYEVYPGKNDKGCDFRVADRSYELKCNKGSDAYGRPYQTCFMEVYADNAKTVMAEWMRFPVNRICIVNQHAQTAYVFDGDMLRSYCANQPLVNGGWSHGDKSLRNWGVKVEWECEEAGFLFSWRLPS